MENPQGEFRVLNQDALKFFCEQKSGDNLLHKTPLDRAREYSKENIKTFARRTKQLASIVGQE